MNQFTASHRGLITGGLMIALALFFFYELKQPVDSPYQYYIYTVYTLGIIWNLLAFNKKADGTTRFKDYFSAGFKTFIIITFLMAVFSFIFFFFHPEIRDNKIELNNQLVIQQGNYTPAEIAENAKRLKDIYMPMTIAITTFMYLFLGALITAIISGVMMQIKKI
ncbi:MAG: DUF4199 domain-containing protein [Sphingobacteriales bacterium]|nr:DUF4199 domain-containing protein [Sphingobacteriales bacterium]